MSFLRMNVLWIISIVDQMYIIKEKGSIVFPFSGFIQSNDILTLWLCINLMRWENWYVFAKILFWLTRKLIFFFLTKCSSLSDLKICVKFRKGSSFELQSWLRPNCVACWVLGTWEYGWDLVIWYRVGTFFLSLICYYLKIS
jgi:hypothetical protein